LPHRDARLSGGLRAHAGNLLQTRDDGARPLPSDYLEDPQRAPLPDTDVDNEGESTGEGGREALDAAMRHHASSLNIPTDVAHATFDTIEENIDELVGLDNCMDYQEHIMTLIADLHSRWWSSLSNYGALLPLSMLIRIFTRELAPVQYAFSYPWGADH